MSFEVFDCLPPVPIGFVDLDHFMKVKGQVAKDKFFLLKQCFDAHQTCIDIWFSFWLPLPCFHGHRLAHVISYYPADGFF